MCVFPPYSHLFLFVCGLQGNLEFPVLLSSSLSLGFSPIKYLFSSFLLLLPIHICCHGHSMCLFLHYSHVFVPRGGPWSLISYILLSSSLFLSCPSMILFSFSSVFYLSIVLYVLLLSFVFNSILCVSFPTIATCLWPAGESEFCYLRGSPSMMFLSFSSMSFCPFIILGRYFPSLLFLLFPSFSSAFFLPVDLDHMQGTWSSFSCSLFPCSCPFVL